jgi:hypothetical protein
LPLAFVAIERARQLGPFGRHFPQDDAVFSAAYRPRNSQTALGVSHVFVRIGHNCLLDTNLGGVIPRDEWDFPHLAVTFRYFDPPAIPGGYVVLFQVMDDLNGLFASRRIVGQKLRRFEVIKPVAVAE